MFNKDYKEMLQSLLSHKVKFLVVGAYSVHLTNNHQPGSLFLHALKSARD